MSVFVWQWLRSPTSPPGCVIGVAFAARAGALAPVPFGVVCFRARPRGVPFTAAELDLFNERLLEAVNASGEVFLSHSRLNGVFVIRMAIGHLRTTTAHTARAWQLLSQHTAALARQR